MKVYVLHEFVFDNGSEDFGVWAGSCSSIKSVEKVLNHHFNGYGNKKKVLEILYSLGS